MQSAECYPLGPLQEAVHPRPRLIAFAGAVELRESGLKELVPRGRGP